MKFKVGDWVTTRGAVYKLDFADIIRFTDEEIELWQPQVDEYVWYNQEIVQVIDSHNLKIRRQNSDSYEEVNVTELEPFIKDTL